MQRDGLGALAPEADTGAEENRHYEQMHRIQQARIAVRIATELA